MAKVKAKRTVYLGEHGGYRAEGEVFDYAGPEHKHLEILDDKEEETEEAGSAKPEKKGKKGS